MLNKKIYSLKDIEKLFSRTPILFIVLLAFLLVTIAYFILNAKYNNKIELLQQKYLLQYDFEKKLQLNSFINSLDDTIDNTFLDEEKKLKEITYKASGFIASNYLNDLGLVKKYLNKIEKEHSIEFVLFKKNTLKIMYGRESINYIQKLIFSQELKQNLQDITLQYIYSQGKNNLQYWKDDLKKTVRLSFFDTLLINGQEYLIGSFSTISSIEDITKKTILNNIRSNNNHFWFFDLITKKIYNFKNNKEYMLFENIKYENKKSQSYEILTYYYNHYSYSKQYSDILYLNTKYNFIISSYYNKDYALNEIKDSLSMIKKEYKNTLYQVFFLITMLISLLILFTFVFTRFIKSIFTKYNGELENKNLSIEQLKNRFELAIIASNDGLWDIDF